MEMTKEQEKELEDTKSSVIANMSLHRPLSMEDIRYAVEQGYIKGLDITSAQSNKITINSFIGDNACDIGGVDLGKMKSSAWTIFKDIEIEPQSCPCGCHKDLYKHYECDCC